MIGFYTAMLLEKDETTKSKEEINFKPVRPRLEMK